MNTEMQRRLFMPLVRGLLVCLLGSSAIAAAAPMAITEVEPNDSIASAQPTPVPPEGLAISGVIGTIVGGITNDVDYFRFDGTQGDTPSFMIVGAMKPNATGICTGFSSIIGLYNSAGVLWGQAEANCPFTDALLNNVTLPATGTYIVAVSGYPHYFSGVPNPVTALNLDMPTPGGAYQLVISGVRNPNAAPAPTPAPTPTPTPSPHAKQVPIEVKHWHQDGPHDERDLGKRNGQDPITVVIFSMAESAKDKFDAMTVDENSLTFGATGYEKSLFRCRKEGKDVNGDGHLDKVCYFKPDIAGFHSDDQNAVQMNGHLMGRTNSGQQIEGSAALKVFSVPAQKRRFEHHDDQGNGEDGLQNGNNKRKN